MTPETKVAVDAVIARLREGQRTFDVLTAEQILDVIRGSTAIVKTIQKHGLDDDGAVADLVIELAKFVVRVRTRPDFALMS